MAKFKLEIVTPDRMFYQGEADMIVVRGIAGEMGILKDHEPFVTPLSIGQVRIKDDGQFKSAALSQGYMEVLEEKVVILSDTAEWPDEIDIERAEQARVRAEKRLEQKVEGLDILRAEIALKKAVTRIGVAKLPSRH
ncbi:ATP synthase F1 subcomplex epsilon subunit [Dethiosulfatibacter aminovorans DSM 17477]|uniref:ATP synthase epsilon chain n=1 Tax=Dethiosulfatibacter aminovorans DSM 17477 TaxID=1121476 RepID=A0A1M6LU33_9FIRM|nr:F0F1 ATP synthase subunit epsilon [Dethiosulfatibacter aminovorans]SHJ74622.1 ATP synthase F1 subcomplex epsilon subunit [Dethiosulfatibacter aminovorans DSM 17477]